MSLDTESSPIGVEGRSTLQSRGQQMDAAREWAAAARQRAAAAHEWPPLRASGPRCVLTVACEWANRGGGEAVDFGI